MVGEISNGQAIVEILLFPFLGSEASWVNTPSLVSPREWRPQKPCLFCDLGVGRGTERGSLVSHYSAIGDTNSCDAPYSVIGFRGKLFLRYRLSKACLWTVLDHFYGKKWGCSSDSLRYHGKHSATGVLLHLKMPWSSSELRDFKSSWRDFSEVRKP